MYLGAIERQERSLEGDTLVWDIRWLQIDDASRLRAEVCAQRLKGAGSFAETEMLEPVLRGAERLRNVCNLRGPLALEYWNVFRGTAKAGEHPVRPKS